MRHLLDTNCWIAFFKRRNSPLGIRIENTLPAEIATCSIVRAELLHGAEKYENVERRADLVRRTLSLYASLPFDDAAADHFARIRHCLQVKGMAIGPYDLQIAAVCLAHDLTIVTNNVREFSRVDGLRVEDWTT